MEIACKFGDVHWLLLLPKTIYTCTVNSCNIRTREIAIAAFKGKHETSKNNNSVTALRFVDTDVRYIPKNLTKIFPNLTYLAIRNCGLKEVLAADMMGLARLQVFWVPENKITMLPVDLFKRMPILKEVDFKSNLIQKLDVKVLEPIKNLILSFCVENNVGIDEMFKKKNGTIEDFINRLKILGINEENSTSSEMMSKQLENLYATGKHSDFTIKVRDKEYRVHKCILASQSSVFDNMFSENVEDATNTFNKIKNFSQETFEEFLRYFYHKTVLSEEKSVDLLELAAEFDFSILRRECEAIVSQTINTANVCQIYNLAVIHSLPQLKRTAFDVIKGYHSQVDEFLFDKPGVVNAIIEAKKEYNAKLEVTSERLIE